MALFLALAASASVVDARERRLPNPILAAMAALAVVGQCLRALGADALAWTPLWALLGRSLPSPAACVVGGLAVTAAALFGELLWRRRRGSVAFGLGDVKLLGCWGLATGPVFALAGLALGCGLGACFSLIRRQRTFPLGPWMNGACAGLCAVSWAAPGLLWS